MTEEYLSEISEPMITKDSFTYRDHVEIDKVENIIEEIKNMQSSVHDDAQKGFGEEEREERRTKLFELFDKASDYLATILQERSHTFGELAYECGDVSFMYGDLLLRRAKEHNNLLLYSKLQKSIIEKQKEEEASIPLSNASSSTHIFNEDQENEEENEEETLNMDDIEDTLETAWNSLETARVIFKKYLEEKVASSKDKKYIEEKLADVYYALADFNKENENFAQAVEDYQNSLALIPKGEYRKRAGVYSELAITLMFQQKLEKGLEHFKLAAEALQQHVDNCKRDADDVSEILHDLRLRISEMEEEQKEALLAKQEEHRLREQELEQRRKSAEIANQKVNVLIPKRKPKPVESGSMNESTNESNKRKREDEADNEENDKKKVKMV